MQFNVFEMKYRSKPIVANDSKNVTRLTDNILKVKFIGQNVKSRRKPEKGQFRKIVLALQKTVS